MAKRLAAGDEGTKDSIKSTSSPMDAESIPIGNFQLACILKTASDISRLL
jgi:hypothetical protein